MEKFKCELVNENEYKCTFKVTNNSIQQQYLNLFSHDDGWIIVYSHECGACVNFQSKYGEFKFDPMISNVIYIPVSELKNIKVGPKLPNIDSVPTFIYYDGESIDKKSAFDFVKWKSM